MEIEQMAPQVKRLQRQFFGERYVGANLGSVKLTDEHAMRLKSWLEKKSGLMLLSGRPGCGKTYLCAAILSWMFSKVSDVYGMKEREFLQRIRASLDLSGDYNMQINYQTDHELFFYDDLGSTGQGQTGWRQEVIFAMVDRRYESRMPTVITTNFTRHEVLEKIGERAYSRIYAEENTIIEMFNYPDLRYPLYMREGELKK